MVFSAFSKHIRLLLVLVLGLCSCLTLAASGYTELLNLRTLPQDQLLASFSFQSNASSESFNRSHFRYAPRALSQIIQHSRTKELHLRFTTGRWDQDSWGPRPRRGTREGSTGVELWAWVDAINSQAADELWLRLTNALSGLFCSSINFLDQTRTFHPQRAFSPEAVNANYTHAQLKHGILAREVVCTENLTPFMKLLPCKGKAGISSLFDGHKLFDSSWQSMSIDVRPVCSSEGRDCRVEVEQTVDMVLDIERSKRPRHDPIPRPVQPEDLPCDESKLYHRPHDSCYPVPPTTTPAFSLHDVFGRPIRGTCSLVEDNGVIPPTLCLDVSNDAGITIDTPGNFLAKDNGPGSRCYVMPVGTDFDLQIGEQTLPQSQPSHDQNIKIERTISGRGQERGGLKTTISNSSPTDEANIVYLETLPWFMKPYLHTLRAEISPTSAATLSDPVHSIEYQAERDRERGTMLEVTLTIPASSVLTMSYDFDKAILRYTEYPPDPNRGFEVAPAVVRMLGSNGSTLGYIRTTSLLLYLPTPDFSMPYNVIILTSTVIALGFGSIFNLLVRRFVGADEVPALRIAKLKDRLRGKLLSWRAKLQGQSGSHPKSE